MLSQKPVGLAGISVKVVVTTFNGDTAESQKPVGLAGISVIKFDFAKKRLLANVTKACRLGRHFCLSRS